MKNDEWTKTENRCIPMENQRTTDTRPEREGQRHTNTKRGDKEHAVMECVKSRLFNSKRLSRNRAAAVVWWLLLTVSYTVCTVYATKSGMLVMPNKTMGGTVSNWLHLGFHRATISSESLIRNSVNSKN